MPVSPATPAGLICVNCGDSIVVNTDGPARFAPYDHVRSRSPYCYPPDAGRHAAALTAKPVPA